MKSDTAWFRATTAPLELMEREAWFDSYLVEETEAIAALALRAERLGQVAAIGMQLPVGICNRAIGLGIDRPVTEAELDAVISWMNRNASRPWALPIAPMALDARLEGWLAARGFTRGAGQSRLVHRLGWIEPEPRSTSLVVLEVLPERAVDFGTVMVQGFGLPPAQIPWVSLLVGRPGWRAYLAYDGDEPVATGALYISGDQAWLGYDATLAPYRGRGAQSALARHRLADCQRLGVTLVTAETMHPPPGEEAAYISHRNLRRAGFELAYVRYNYLPPKVV